MSEPEMAHAPLDNGSPSHPQDALQAPVEAIASNVSRRNRVAPNIAQTSVIDDIYEFADRLRAGSAKR